MRSYVADADVIHTSPVIGRALANELVRQEPEFRIGQVDYSWVRFAATAFPAPLVVLDAYLDDHVPLALKVRALRQQRSRVVLLGIGGLSPLGARARDEGAELWLDPALGLAETTAEILRLWASSRPGASHVEFAPDLTQREIQILALYAARRAPSITQLSRALGLTAETVRTHLRTGRAKYSALGHVVGNRAALANALEADGLLIPADTWAMQHRW